MRRRLWTVTSGVARAPTRGAVTWTGGIRPGGAEGGATTLVPYGIMGPATNPPRAWP
jgi:hypothetical protein